MASPSAAIAEAEQLYESVFAQNNCGIAAAVLFLYDNLLNLDREIQFIWASPKNAASLLYLYNRYIPVLWSCLGQALISSVSQTLRSSRLDGLPH
ncbi:hypothetical protein BD413DRAFT_13354 [Trametes elegans]|nr:hypothetical protein BD413DRAFT_13354 [Trametes elegans]